MLSRFETTDDAQDTKSIDEAKEGRCYEWERLGMAFINLPTDSSVN